jgi:hypothetical protein
MFYLSEAASDKDLIKEYISEITSENVMKLDEEEVNIIYKSLLEDLYLYEDQFLDFCDELGLTKQKDLLVQLIARYDPPPVPKNQIEAVMTIEQLREKRKKEQEEADSPDQATTGVIEKIGPFPKIPIKDYDYDKAINQYKTELTRIGKTEDSPEKDEKLIRTSINYGETLMRGGKPEKAIPILSNAKILLENKFKVENHCDTLMYLGESMLLVDKEIEDALNYLYDAVNIATQGGLKQRLIYAMYVKGLIHIKMEHFHDAVFSLSIADELNGKLNLVQLDDNISKNLALATKRRDASPDLEESEAMYIIRKQAESDLRVAKLFLSIKEYKSYKELIARSTDAFVKLDDVDAINEINELIKGYPV